MVDGVEKSYRRAFGNMSAEEIVRADWARHYEPLGVPLNRAKLVIKIHVDNQLPIARLGNTLILITPQEDYKTIKFHTITADNFDSYFSLMLKFFISMNLKRGTQIAYTYLNDKKIFDAIKKNLNAYVSLDLNEDDPREGKYILTIDVGQFVSDMESRRGVLN